MVECSVGMDGVDGGGGGDVGGGGGDVGGGGDGGDMAIVVWFSASMGVDGC